MSSKELLKNNIFSIDDDDDDDELKVFEFAQSMIQPTSPESDIQVTVDITTKRPNFNHLENDANTDENFFNSHQEVYFHFSTIVVEKNQNQSKPQVRQTTSVKPLANSSSESIRKYLQPNTERRRKLVSPFILYSKLKSPEIEALHPDKSKAVIAKIIYKLWWELAVDEREYWESVSDGLRNKTS
ncbi:hypothetical protein G9A89_021897 [Geosiphon pyriformis]|nr:hypothetical protein G9A89_021897 [Geosiphon pyriformis]